MTEKERLLNEAKQLIEDYHSLDLYKRYLSLRKAVLESKELSDLYQKQDSLKRSAKFLSGDEKKECLKKAKEYYDSYRSSPLYVNYLQCKEELIKIVSPLAIVLE